MSKLHSPRAACPDRRHGRAGRRRRSRRSPGAPHQGPTRRCRSGWSAAHQAASMLAGLAALGEGASSRSSGPPRSSSACWPHAFMPSFAVDVADPVPRRPRSASRSRGVGQPRRRAVATGGSVRGRGNRLPHRHPSPARTMTDRGRSNHSRRGRRLDHPPDASRGRAEPDQHALPDFFAVDLLLHEPPPAPQTACCCGWGTCGVRRSSSGGADRRAQTTAAARRLLGATIDLGLLWS